jgi:uncharacterized membrane protein YcaP (DUF421 family)
MDIVLRVALLYLVVLFTLRMTTRKTMRTSTPLDMVVIFLVGGMATQAVLTGDQSITGVTLAIGTVAGMHMLISAAKLRWPLVGFVSDGSPVVIYSNGRWARPEMKRLRVQEQDVYAEMRQNGHKSIDEVETAVMEHNGALTILAKDRKPAP